MMLRIFAVLLAFGLAGCDAGCSAKDGCVKGSGNVIAQARPVEKFTAIRFDAIGTFLVERTGADSLTVETDDNVQSIVTSEVKDGTLVLAGCENCSPTKTVFRVTVSDLRKIDLTGVGSGDASKLDGPTLSVNLSGVGSLMLSGRVDDLTISSSGTGSCNAAELTAKRATVVLAGVGDVRVNASEELDANVSGIGKIRYRGSPKLKQDVSGVGSIQQEK